MGKFDGVLLISDYDDTLYGSDASVSEENRAAIRRFVSLGGRFTVATGRARNAFAPQIQREGLAINAPVILSNGSAIYDFSREELLLQTFLSPDSAEHLAQVAEAFPDLGFEAYHGEDIYVHNGNDVTWSHVKRVNVGYTQCPIRDMPLPWTKVILQQEYGLLQAVQSYIRERWPELYEVIFSNRYLLELTAKGSNKGTSVLRVADFLGISRSHIYCAGDNQNDLPMLAVAAGAFAPANCAQEVRDWGAFILRSCDEHCIAQLIEILDKKYERRGCF